MEFFEEGNVIFKHGALIEELYILQEGSLDVFHEVNDEDDILIERVKTPGSHFG